MRGRNQDYVDEHTDKHIRYSYTCKNNVFSSVAGHTVRESGRIEHTYFLYDNE